MKNSAKRSPFDDFAALSDPYDIYRELRENAPVYWDGPEDWWLLTRYDDVASALRDARFSAEVGTPSVDRLPVRVRPEFDRLKTILSTLPLFSEAPVHTRVRSELQRAFTPRSVERLADTLHGRAKLLADRMATADAVDALDDVAVPMADLAFTEIMGVAQADLPALREINDGVIGALGGGAGVEQVRVAQDAVRDLTTFLRRYRAGDGPGGGVMEILDTALDQGRISEDEAVAALVQLVTGSLDPTPQTLATAVLLLMRHPDQRARLRDDPTLVAGAVEEALRLEPPFTLIHRVALADVRYGDQVVAAGEHVALLLGAANRDPERFPEPDRFLPERSPNKHLSFGVGHHFCLGGGLVRLVGRTTVAALLPILDGWRLADEPTYLPLMGIRKLRSGLPLVRARG